MNAPATQPKRTVTVGDTRITLLGTAHVSRVSADAVQDEIATGEYDAVAVELCPSRHQNMVNPDQLARQELLQVIRAGKAPLVAASLALSAFQQRLADQFGVEPGADMRTALSEAKQADLPVLLVDRDLGTTLKRCYRQLSWFRRLPLFFGLVASVVSKEDVSEEQIEKLKEGDILEATFNEFADADERLYRPLIDERDRYMAARLRQEAQRGYRHVLAVVGAGHLQGIAHYLEEAKPSDPASTLATLDTLPPPARWPKVIPWLIVALIISGFAIGFSRDTQLGWQLVLDWVVINGGFAAIGAVIALAHPLTILATAIAAPLTSLNPTIGAGMVSAAVEAVVRKPNVGDFARLKKDTASPKGWWRNRISRVLLVFVFSTLGSAIATYTAGFLIADRLMGA
ncbi:TraB/GumN family protein [Marinobacteraceae bacterium S3BR75-40.1]